jgi:hypothetical protein
MSYSRFLKTDTIEYKGVITYGRWKRFEFLSNELPEDLIGLFTVSTITAGRPDLISDAVYDTTKFDWVLLAFNGVREPFGWPVAGDLVRYPIERIVAQELYR